MAIAGASRYLGASVLANTRGLAARAPTLLGETSTANMLSAGRKLAVLNTGVSASARALNNTFLSQSAGLANQLLSLAAGTDSNVEGAKLEILALRSKVPTSQLARTLVRGSEVDTEA